MKSKNVGFSDAFEEVSAGNRRFKQNEYIADGMFPVVDQGKDLIAGFINDQSVLVTNTPLIVFGDHTRILKFIDFPFAIGADGVKLLKPKTGLDPKYAFYALQKVHVPDTGYNRHFKYFKEAKIPLPDLQTQKHIASILDKADALRQQNRQLLNYYDELLQSTFIEMFGDPVENPKGWEVKELKHFGKVQTGNTPPKENEKNYGDFIEWIKTDNINPSKMHPETSKEYLSETGLKIGRSVEKNSIIVTCIAGSSISIGNVALLDRKVAFNQQMNSISPNINVDPIFLYFLFKVNKKYIQDNATNGMKRIITKSVFENLRMFLPPLKAQQSFVAIAKYINAQKEHERISLTENEALLQSLLVSYFGDN